MLSCSLLAPSDEDLTGGIVTSAGGGGGSGGPSANVGGGGAGVGGSSSGSGGSGGSNETVGEYPVQPLGGSGGAAGSSGEPPATSPPDAGVSEPPPCMDCETVRFTGGVSTVELGSPGGGLYMDICPRDRVVVGMDYRYTFGSPADFGYLTSVALVCGELTPNRRAGTLGVVVGAPLPPRGVGEGVSGTGGRCPIGQVVTGFEGARNFDGTTSELREFTLHCAPLALGDDGSVALGTSQPTQPMSAEFAVSTVLPSEVMPLQPCPEGQVARGAAFHAGRWVDGISLVCSAPVLALPDGQACGAAIECQSGSCDGSCQARTCTAPAGCGCRLLESTQYAFCEAAQTQPAAAATCAGVGMHLANAFDPVVHGWLRSNADQAGIQAEFWLGGDDLVSEGNFVWAEDGAVDLASELWDRNLPRGGVAENCMEMSRDGRWDDADCNLTLPFVCETPVP